MINCMTHRAITIHSLECNNSNCIKNKLQQQNHHHQYQHQSIPHDDTHPSTSALLPLGSPCGPPNASPPAPGEYVLAPPAPGRECGPHRHTPPLLLPLGRECGPQHPPTLLPLRSAYGPQHPPPAPGECVWPRVNRPGPQRPPSAPIRPLGTSLLWIQN